MTKLPKITLEEIKKHNNINSLWIIVKNKVYDITEYINQHPAGIKCLIDNGGKDCTFHISFHNKIAKQILKKYLIGYVSY